MAELGSGHAALMDKVYRRQRYVYDFTRKYYLFGRDRLIRGLALKPGDHVIEIGCGTARNLIKMARRHPNVTFYGLDASEEMLKSARHRVGSAGKADQIRLAHGFAESLSPAMFGRTEPFDHAIFSYSLSMIPDWKQALRSACAAMAKNGIVHVVDFADLSGLGSLGRRLLTTWLQLFHVSPRVEILARIENSDAIYLEQKPVLQLLPARYAFIWRASVNAAQSLTL